MDTRTQQAEILFFTTPHCSACSSMRPIARDVANRYDGAVALVEVDSSTDSVSSSNHRVRSVPTFIAINNGSEVGRAIGTRSPTELEALFDAAASGTRTRGRISSTDRMLRVGVGIVFAGAALLTSTPLLWPLAGAALLFATWDLVQ